MVKKDVRTVIIQIPTINDNIIETNNAIKFLPNLDFCNH